MLIENFYDPVTFTFSYLVADTTVNRCALIDTVLDYDPNSGRTSTQNADKLIDRVRQLDLQVDWILETHVHADHLSASEYIQKHLGGKIAIGEKVTLVQETFAKLFNCGSEFKCDGSQFDYLLKDQEVIKIGGITLQSKSTPGHTPACSTYVVSDAGVIAAFVGDTLFYHDIGTARCDFPGGNAQTLYQSIQAILSLPAEAKIYYCHDYPPDTRELQVTSNISEIRQKNIHVSDGISESEYIAMRTVRDQNLAVPVLLLPAVQVNMRAGRLPPAACRSKWSKLSQNTGKRNLN